MRVISCKPVKPGSDMRRVTVILAPGEEIVAVHPDKHYSMGEPMHEDVFAGHIIAGATEVSWCSIEQKWRGS